MIPVYCMEEHHEAFYYWADAIEKGFMRPEGNILFHVDHHDDLECGGYHWDFTKAFSGLKERYDFTYSRLGIADFIVPALYEGIFSEMYNMKSVVPGAFIRRERFVKRVGKNALVLGEYVPFLHAEYRKSGKEAYRFFSYFEGSLSQTGELKQVVLDIDLDYFCWDDALGSVPAKRIEITEQSFREYMENPYHPFRILPRKLLQAQQEDGRFFLSYKEPPIAEKERKEETVVRSIERFITWLSDEPWEPDVIMLCRSARSGYLPVQYAEKVERMVKDGLEALYGSKIKF